MSAEEQHADVIPLPVSKPTKTIADYMDELAASKARHPSRRRRQVAAPEVAMLSLVREFTATHNETNAYLLRQTWPALYARLVQMDEAVHHVR